jgi:hypothetical protein
MMGRSTYLALGPLAIFTIDGAAACALAADPSGAIRFCRETDLVEPAQTELNRTHLRLPSGLMLDDYGQQDDPDLWEHRWPLTIITLKPVDMPPHVKCDRSCDHISANGAIRVSYRSPRYRDRGRWDSRRESCPFPRLAT